MMLFEFQIGDAGPVRAVKGEPRVQLTVRRMVRVDRGAQLLVAVLPSNSVRTTSALARFDAVTRLATTSSGRVYELLTGPTLDPVQRQKIAAALAHAGWGTGKDVSDSVWALVTIVTH